MKTEVVTKKIGGSIGIIIPKEVIKEERIQPEQKVKIDIEKVSDVSFLWGKYKNVRIPTNDIIKETDEGEDD